MYLKRIKRINCGLGYGQDQNANFLTCYNFRATVTHVVVNFSNKAKLTVEGQTGDALSFLPSLTCLTHLTFINTITSAMGI